MLDRLKHRFKWCGGFELKLVMDHPIISARCTMCMDEFDLIKEQWCK